MHRILTLLFVAMLCAGQALAQSTMTLDASYGNDGVWERQGTSVELMAVMPDGKVVVATSHTRNEQVGGYAYHSAGLSCLDANGDLDPGFNGGRPLSIMQGEDVWVNEMVVHAGRLYVCGQVRRSYGEPTYTYVTVVNPDGTIYPGFGTDGISLVSISAVGMTVAPSGRIYVCGSKRNASSNFWDDGVVARLDATGALDSSWSSDGIAVVPGSPNGSSVSLRDVLVDKQQRVVAVGVETMFSPDSKLTVAAGFKADGSFDTGFQSGNVLRTVPPSSMMGWNIQVHERPGGGYLLVGNTGESSDHPCVLGLNAAGAVDAGYGNAGWVVIPVPPGGNATPASGSILLPDGRLFVGGMISRYDSSAVIGWLLTATGQLDGSFGVGGVAQVSMPGEGGIGTTCFAAAPDGKLYVGGRRMNPPGPPVPEVKAVVARLSMDLLSPLWGSADEGELLVYPNPAVSGGWVYLSGQTNGPLELFDARGRIVTRWSASEGALEMPALPAGVYLLRAAKLSQRLLVR